MSENKSRIVLGKIIKLEGSIYTVQSTSGETYTMRTTWDTPRITAYLGMRVRFKTNGSEVVEIEKFGCSLQPSRLCSFCMSCRAPF